MLKRTLANVRQRLVSGLLVVVPFGVTLLVLGWLFGWLRSALRPLVQGLTVWLGLVSPDGLTVGQGGPARRDPSDSAASRAVDAPATMFALLTAIRRLRWLLTRS